MEGGERGRRRGGRVWERGQREGRGGEEGGRERGRKGSLCSGIMFFICERSLQNTE